MKIYVKSNNVEAFDNPFKKMKDAKKDIKDLAKSTEDDVANIKDQIEKFKKLNNITSATGSASVGMLDAIIDCYNTRFSTLTVPIYKALHLEYAAPEYDVQESLELADDTTISELYYTLREIAIDNAYYEVLDDFDVDVLESTDITASDINADSKDLLNDIEKAVRTWLTEISGMPNSEASSCSEVMVYQEQDGRYHCIVSVENMDQDDFAEMLEYLDDIILNYDDHGTTFTIDEPGYASAYVSLFESDTELSQAIDEAITETHESDITASTVTDVLDEYLPDETYAKLTNVEKKIIAKASNQTNPYTFMSGALETLDLLDIGMSDAMCDAWEIISMHMNRFE